MTRRLAPVLLLALGLACSPGKGSTHGTDGGVACASNKDCPSTYVCTQGVCTAKQAGACTKGSCPAHEFCGSDGTCHGSGTQSCQSSGDCGGGFTCDATTHLCVEGCVLTSDCASNEVCNPVLKYCAECNFDTQCQNNQTRTHCDQSTGQCVACLATGECPAGSYCVLGTGTAQDNTCQKGCLTGGDCSTSTRCDRTGSGPGKCVQCTVSTESQDCTDPSKPVCNPANQMCVQCVRDGQCGVKVCDTSTNTCVDCLDDTTCNMGTVCDKSTHTCAAGCVDAAGDNARCPPPDPTKSGDTLCDPSKGSFGQCVQCVHDPDCSPGQICDSTGTCITGCRGSATCPKATPICDLLANNGNGKCVQCRTDADCPASNLHCDTTSSSPTYETCVCLAQGQPCRASADCGNPPNQNNVCGPAWCLAQVGCGTPTCTNPSASCYRWVPLATDVCGNLCSDTVGGTGCPGGWVCRYVRNEQYNGTTTTSTQGTQCTPPSACN